MPIDMSEHEALWVNTMNIHLSTILVGNWPQNIGCICSDIQCKLFISAVKKNSLAIFRWYQVEWDSYMTDCYSDMYKPRHSDDALI